jgi:apolipoprotein N-acyltransferase
MPQSPGHSLSDSFAGVIPKRIGSWTWLIALCAGAMVPLAFAPFNTWHPAFSYLVFIPVSLFFYLILTAWSARQAFKLGWLFGVGLFAAGVSWLYVAIHDFGQAHWSLAFILTAAFVAFVALYYGLLALSIVKLRDAGLFSEKTFLLFYLPLLWVLFEWLRSWLLTGFPWLLIGYPMIETPFSGMIPILGIYGMSWLVALVSSMICAVVVARIHFMPVLLLLGLLLTVGWQAGKLQWSQPAGESLSVALIQGNVNQSMKWDRQQLEKTKRLYVSLSEPHWDSHDLIIWPENAIPVFYHTLENNFYQQLKEKARQTNTELVTGLPVFNEAQMQYYNSMTNLGAQQGFYFKTRLVPFGEYVPLADLIRGLIRFFDMPMSGFSPGPEQQPLLTIAGYQVLVTICYEDVFAHLVTDKVADAQLLLNLSNNGWYGDSFAPHQHLEMARFRALETSRELIRSTTSGISALIDEKGQIKVKGPQFESTTTSGVIQPRSGTTPYVLWGNYPVFILFLTGLILGIYRSRLTAHNGSSA